MASEVDICNLALANMGANANVASISPPEGSVQAQLCARFYPIARDKLLEDHEWSFAERRQYLALYATNPTDSWLYAYALPADCVKPRAVLLPKSTDDTATQDYVESTADDGSKIILTNVEDAVLVYTRRVTDTAKFGALVIDALAWLLTSFLAGPIIKGSEGAKVKESAYKMYITEKGRAAVADSNARKMNAYGAKHVPAHIKARS